MRLHGRTDAGLNVLSTSILFAILSITPALASSRKSAPPPLPPQDTGFLNRSITLQGIPYKFQV